MHGAVVTVVMCARMQNALHQFRSVLTLCTNRLTKEPNGIQIYHFTINYTISLSSAPFSIFAILSATANWKQLQEKYVSKVIVSFSLSLSLSIYLSLSACEQLSLITNTRHKSVMSIMISHSNSM